MTKTSQNEALPWKRLKVTLKGQRLIHRTSQKRRVFLKYCLHFIQRESVYRGQEILQEVGSGLPPKDFQGLNSHFQD